MPETTKPNPEDVRAAERAAQRSVCDIPDGPLPEDLAAALERRVEVNLEQATDAVVRRVGSLDLEVRRLEGPYRKRAAAAATATPRRTKKRPAVQVKPKNTPKEK